jgi:hypothetical protein
MKLVTKAVCTIVFTLVAGLLYKALLPVAAVLANPVIVNQLEHSDAAFVASQYVGDGSSWARIAVLVFYFLIMALIWLAIPTNKGTK